MPRMVSSKLLRTDLNPREVVNLPDFAGAPGLRRRLLALPQPWQYITQAAAPVRWKFL